MKDPAGVFLSCFSFLAAATMLACGGCVRSEQPLSARKDAKPDLQLVGKWRDPKQKPGESVSGETVVISFDEQGIGNLGLLEEENRRQPVSGAGQFFVTRTPHASYLNLLSFDTDPPKLGTSSNRERYTFIKYEFGEGGKKLTWWRLKDEPFRNAVKEGRLKGRLETTHKGSSPGKENVVLQDSSEAILRFIESIPPEQIFAEPPTSFIKVE